MQRDRNKRAGESIKKSEVQHRFSAGERSVFKIQKFEREIKRDSRIRR